jgi:protein-S-isoprenylcysteine O-methyltransferase Ste14
MTTFERAFVWIGGVLFVAALAGCTWWYLVPLGHSRPDGGWPPIAWDAGLVTIFALHHSVFARDSIKHRLAAIPARLLRSVYVWIASLLLMLMCAVWQPIGVDFYDVGGAAAVVAAIAQLGGVLLIARAVARIDPLELAGIHPTRPADALQVDGPYRLVRHPLYLGWIVAVFGAGHLTGDRLAFAVLTSIYLVVAVPLEERSLRQSFGDEYARYQRAVRWRIIPFLY